MTSRAVASKATIRERSGAPLRRRPAGCAASRAKLSGAQLHLWGRPMSWNYRVIEYRDPVTEEVWMMIQEVYYDKDGAPTSYTDDGANVIGADIDEMGRVLDMMKIALSKPTLKEIDFVQPATIDASRGTP